MRFVAVATLTALLSISVAEGTEIQGVVRSVNAGKNTIVLNVDGKDKSYPVSADAAFVSVSQVPGKKGKTTEKLTPIDGGLGGVKAGARVTVLTETIDDKDVVTSLKLGDGKAAAATPAKKKKKKT
jgi:hypothetical protein